MFRPRTKLPKPTALPHAINFKRPDVTMDPSLRACFLDFHGSYEHSTFLGGHDSDFVELDEHEVSKLPHDFVHMSLCTTPEGTIDMGTRVTPDIVFEKDDGTFAVIEIVTSQSTNSNAVARALERKVDAYSHLFGRKISEFQVVCVTTAGVTLLGGHKPDKVTEEVLVQAYVAGLRIKNKWEAIFGWREDASNDQIKALRSQLSQFEFEAPTAPGVLPMDGLSSDNLVPKFDTLTEYLEKRKGGKKLFSAVVHVPFILPPRAEYIEPEVTSATDVYAEIFTQCWTRLNKPRKTFMELKTQNKENQGKNIDRKVETEKDVIYLAKHKQWVSQLQRRGVMAKRAQDEDFLIAKRAHSQKPLSTEADVTMIDKYLDSDWVKEEEGSDQKTFNENMLRASCIERSNGELPDMIDEFMRETSSRDFGKLKFFERVMREVTMNARRNPTDKKGLMSFVVRKIPEFDAFVVIRTTKYAGGSNFFYTVFFKRSDTTVNDPVFERSYVVAGTNYSHFEFMSVDRNRLSHYQGMTATLVSLTSELYQQEHSEFAPDAINSKNLDLGVIKKPIRVALLILLSSSREVSGILQQLRFFYMTCYSGVQGFREETNKITNKLPDVIRSPLSVYFLRRLQVIQEKELAEMTPHITGGVIGSLEQEDEESGFEADTGNVFQTELPPMPTPFHTTIKTARSMVNAMYYCNLLNKDIGEDGHGAARIVEKTLKREYQFRERGLPKILESVRPDDFNTFQASRPAIHRGVGFLKEDICSANGIEEEDWDTIIESKVLRYMLKSRLTDLATTKSSTVPFNSELKIERGGMKLEEIGQRKKCIEQVLTYIEKGVLDIELTACNIGNVVSEIEENEEGCLQVTCFRKSQIGGDREILVLTFMGRLMLKCTNDMFRCIAEMIGEEKLTDEKSKGHFVSDHYRARRKLMRAKKHAFSATFKFSADMTNWAQLFTLEEFKEMGYALLPPLFHGFLEKAWDYGQKKKIQFPRSLVEMWVKPGFNESDRSTKKAEREFRGMDEPEVCDEKKPWFRNETNMMQGIYHYVSTVYHAVMMKYFDRALSSQFRDPEVGMTMDFEISSDDHGSMTSLTCDNKEQLMIACRRLEYLFLRILHSVHKLFGPRLSFEKTSKSWYSLFEFNSNFMIGNTTAATPIKNLANLCYDNAESSLGKRVCSMFSLLAQFRANGGTGYQCHWSSICQAAVLTENLGSEMDWFDLDDHSDIYERKLSFLGWYPIQNPIVAGLVDAKFYNYVASRDSKENLFLSALYGNEGFEGEKGIEGSHLSFSIFQDKKWRNLLSRKNISYEEESQMTMELLRVHLMGPDDIQETWRDIRHKLCSPGVARSMAFLTRSDMICMSPYMLYAAMFGPHASKKSLSDHIQDELREMSPTLSLQSVYPMHDFMEETLSLMRKEYEPAQRLGAVPRSVHQYLSPYYLTPEHMKHLKSIAATAWFGERRKLNKAAHEDFKKMILEDLPFFQLDDQLGEENVAIMLADPDCPFTDMMEMCVYMESYTSRAKPMKALVLGTAAKGISGIHSLIRNNLVAGWQFAEVGKVVTDAYTLPDDYVPEGISDSLLGMRFEDRCKAWQELISGTENDELLSIMTQDLISSFRDTVPESTYRGYRARDKKSQMLFKFYALCSGKTSLETFISTTEGVPVFIGKVRFGSGEPLGSTMLICKEMGITYRCVRHGEGQWDVRSSSFTNQQPTCISGMNKITTGGVSIGNRVFDRFQRFGSEIVATFTHRDLKDAHVVLQRGRSRLFSSEFKPQEYPEILNLWLTRENTSAMAFKVAKAMSGDSWVGEVVAKAILAYSVKFLPHSGFIKMTERLVKDDEDLFSAIRDDDEGMMEDLLEEIYDVDIVVDYEGYVDMDFLDNFEDFGLESGFQTMAEEGQNAALASNHSLRNMVMFMITALETEKEMGELMYSHVVNKMISEAKEMMGL